MPPKTTIEKSPLSSPDVTVFRITGTLGFHEKATLEKLFGECKRRNLNRIVLDVGELNSLGGGCASIIRSEASNGLVLGVAAAKKTVLKFLQDKASSSGVVISDTVEEAIRSVLEREAPEHTDASEGPGASELDSDDALVSDESLDEVLRLDDEEPSGGGDAVAGGAAAEPEPTRAQPYSAEPPTAPQAPPPFPQPVPEAAGQQRRDTPTDAPDARELKKRIVQYNTLLSINSDFSRITDRKSLLDTFLLTTIAQVGVVSAVFLERSRGYFYPAAVKGIEWSEVRGLTLAEDQLDVEEWTKVREVHRLEEAPFRGDAAAGLDALGCSYVVPFVVHADLRGIVLLGPPIKDDLDASTIEFLKILVNQAAIAYERTARQEEENDRTLGLVQTLIALIEENTLARGNTNLLSSYVYVLAQSMHYPEEHLRALMYGTVLRDIGMIKVSDLIVRSPRELMPEEWEIIKRHPIDGAEMLKQMHFSDHAVGIVLCHHERFNGEGYPHGIQGQQIPLGARIVSVVESFAAMLQDRPTRPALSQEEALNTLRENWGMRYDPEVIRHFVEIVENEIRTGEHIGEKKFELFRV